MVLKRIRTYPWFLILNSVLDNTGGWKSTVYFCIELTIIGGTLKSQHSAVKWEHSNPIESGSSEGKKRDENSPKTCDSHR